MTRSPIVYFLFFISGITALVYEIIWTRMLTLVFGHTVFSVSIVLAAFMAGLGFGSYAFGYAIDRISLPSASGDENAVLPPVAGWDLPKPLLVYGWIEILLFATCSVLSLVFANFSTVYAWAHAGLPDSHLLQNLIKAGLAFTFIFIPTTLMGATLPIISKYYVTDNTKLGTQIGYLYGINTLGASFGCLLTGFLLINLLGVLQTALCAALANLFIGVSAIRIYQESAGGARVSFKLPKFSLPPFRFSGEEKFWMGVSFICGFTALAYEVVWTRLLVFSISSTTYSFSMMLAVFLFGIVLGSFFVVPVISRCAHLRTALIVIQTLIGLYVIASIYSMESFLSAPWNSYNLQDPARTFGRYLKDSAALMMVPTVLLGMSFPILIKIVAGGHEHVGRGTGQIYGSNTLGAIFGSLGAGFLLLPGLGSQATLMMVATLNLLLAMILFRTGTYVTQPLRKGITVVMAAIILYVNMAIPENLLDRFFLRDSVGGRDLDKLLFFEEGLTDTVAVFKDNYGMLDPEAKRLVTNGISMSASNTIATRYMKMFAHVPILLTDNPEDVLVVCFGTGQTTGAAAIHPTVRRVDSIELSPSVVRAGEWFADENHDVLHNPKVTIVFQDGRNHILTTPRMYDVVTSEPPPPRTAFTVNLYTREYYEFAKKKMKPGGIMAQWIPLHSQGAEEVAMHFRTFHSVFPHSMAWLSVANEILIIGSDRPIEIDFQKLKQRFADPVVRKALGDIEIHNVYSFLSNIWFLEEQIEALAVGQPVISDNRPSIEFYLDLGKVIGIAGREQLVFTRAPFEDIARRISNMNETDREELRRYYEAMDLYQRGVMYSNRGQLLEARSLMHDDGLVRYHLQAGRGQVERLARRIEEAPEDVEAMLNLGHAYYQIGEYTKSVEALEKVLNLEPDQSYARLYMGYNLMELGRRDEAKEHFESAMKKDPRQMGAVLQEMALADLLGKLESDTENFGLLIAVAQFYNMKKEYLKALEYSFKALEKDPQDLKLLQSIVFSYRGLGEPGEVLDYATRYSMIEPDNIDVHYIMGEMYAKTLRCEKAVRHLEAVLKKDDTFRDAQKLLDGCRDRLEELRGNDV
ncbi:MAG: fused MFS/spermidine synthase [Nitrospinaceae bacterium]